MTTAPPSYMQTAYPVVIADWRSRERQRRRLIGITAFIAVSAVDVALGDLFVRLVGVVGLCAFLWLGWLVALRPRGAVEVDEQGVVVVFVRRGSETRVRFSWNEVDIYRNALHRWWGQQLTALRIAAHDARSATARLPTWSDRLRVRLTKAGRGGVLVELGPRALTASIADTLETVKLARGAQPVTDRSMASLA